MLTPKHVCALANAANACAPTLPLDGQSLFPLHNALIGMSGAGRMQVRHLYGFPSNQLGLCAV